MKPQLLIHLRTFFETLFFKESSILEEYKLSYEKLKSKCTTMEAMMDSQRLKVDALLKENHERKDYFSNLYEDKIKKEEMKLNSYIKETQSMCKKIENDSQKSTHITKY